VTKSRGPVNQVLGFALTFAREVSTYLRSGQRRQAVRDAVAELIGQVRPRIVIAHSLGSVVTYETLWQHPELTIDLLVTLGSPLAMPRVVFPRLDPEPVNGRGRRPPGVAAWVNLADMGDIVAIPQAGLLPYFDGVTRDEPAIVIDKTAFHSVWRYLTARETAEVLVPCIAGP
jgi:pimeloyl-ACP methyl ester carboxylesterase